MSVQIDKDLCTGCGACVEICPGDLLILGEDGCSFLREARDCWDCMACVKECPSGALEIALPYQVARKGASLRPEVKPSHIRWLLRDRKGKEEEFLIRVR